MGLLDTVLGTDPITIDKTFNGQMDNAVLQVLVDKIRALEADITSDKRLLSLIKVLVIYKFRQNPF